MIPGTPAKFLRWVEKHRSQLSPELLELVHDTHLALAHIYTNRRAKDRIAAKASKKASAPYIERFMAQLLADQVKVPLRVIPGGRREEA